MLNVVNCKPCCFGAFIRYVYYKGCIELVCCVIALCEEYVVISFSWLSLIVIRNMLLSLVSYVCVWKFEMAFALICYGVVSKIRVFHLDCLVSMLIWGGKRHLACVCGY